MADKDISISIKTAADLAAVKQAETALDGLEAQARQTDAALDAVAGSAGTGGGAAGRGKGAAAAIKELAEEAPKAASGGRNLGAVMGQAGFQVQDFAVQVGGGTSALTAFAQQGSQLLGLFGPGGALVGALLAVGAVAFNAFQATAEGGEKSEKAAAKLEEELEKAAKAAAKLQDEFGQDSAEAFIGALEREADSYRKVNAEVERNIELMRARRRAQAEVESERAALELLKIDQDPNLSEDQKIRARGQVQEGIEARRVAERLAEIGERVAKADGEAETRQGAAAKAEKALADANAELGRAKQELDALKERDSPRRKQSLESAERDLAARVARDRELGGEIAFLQSQGAVVPQDLMDEFRSVGRQVNVARSVRDQRAGRVATDEERARIIQLEGTEGDTGSIAALTKGIADLQKAVEDARNDANTAGANRNQVAAIAAEEVQGVTSAFALSRERRGLATTGAAADAAAKAEEKRRDEAEKAARERQQAFDKAEGIADQAASAAGSGGPRRRDAVAAANFEQLGDALQDRQTIAGVDALQKSIERFAASRRSEDADVARKFRKMAEELDGLRAKLRTGGDGK